MNRRNQPCCDRNAVGIVFGVNQQLGNIYPAQTAILRGTLYPELDKPLACASSPSGCTEPSSSQIAAFSAWEVRLYLNTHPDDERALRLYQQLCQQAPRPNYACTFASCMDRNRWTWIDDPWPWECVANGKGA